MFDKLYESYQKGLNLDNPRGPSSVLSHFQDTINDLTDLIECVSIENIQSENLRINAIDALIEILQSCKVKNEFE